MGHSFICSCSIGLVASSGKFLVLSAVSIVNATPVVCQNNRPDIFLGVFSLVYFCLIFTEKL